MTRIPTRCRPTRLGSPGRCSCIAIASASSPAGSKRSISGCSSRTPSRRCRSTARNTWPPCRASARNAICSGSICSRWGPSALDYLTELTHRRPRIWLRDVDRLHALLATYGDDAMRAAFARGLAEQAIGAEYIAHYLAAP